MRIGIDLGGSKIAGIALDITGRTIAHTRIATPPDYAACLTAIATLVMDLEARAGGRCTVGVGHPGVTVPHSGRIQNANSIWLNGQPLTHDLSQHLSRPVRLANDANCFALSEATDGAGRGHDCVFGVILGTGVGGGVVTGGRVRRGAHGIAGEWGHTPLPWAATDERAIPCWCGRHGCIETWLSGPAFERWCGHTPAQAPVDQLALYADRLARGLAVVIDILDPDIIVLGGGVSNIDALYPLVNATLPQYVFSGHLTTQVVRNSHGDSSGVRGAAWLHDDDAQRQPPPTNSTSSMRSPSANTVSS